MPTCILRDGRSLEYREYGTPDGFPVLFFHGGLNSRLFEPAWERTEAATKTTGARVIAVDRPGYGCSDFLPDRRYAIWAQDVRELVKHLSLPAYAILGFSSGGPNAMVCAADASGAFGNGTAAESVEEEGLPTLAALGLIASDGPYLAMPGRKLLKQMYGTAEAPSFGDMMPRGERSAARLRSKYKQMGNAARRAVALRDLEEATRQGVRAAAQDMMLEGGDWGFSPSQIKTALVPTLMWHGDADEDVPVEVGRWNAEQIEGCRATFIEGESHTLLRRHWQEILSKLVAAARSRIAGEVVSTRSRL